MPDQSSASSEHALIQEVTAPLAALPEDPLNVASDVDFPVVLRGYDRIAVDAYVKKTSQLVAELQATRSPEAAVRRALERVGEEVSGILKRAHETAAQITAQSRSDAEDRLEAARQEAVRITADARSQMHELDVETDRVWAERQRIVEDARDLARQLLALADSAAERFPADDVTEAEPAGDEEADAESEAPSSPAARAGEDVDSEAAEAAARLSATPEFTDARGSRSHTDPSEVDETLERERTFILPPDQEQ
jgi:vacuolar-type H+-ATPase subunit H